MKHIIVTVLALMLVLGLTACKEGGNSNATTPTTTQTPDNAAQTTPKSNPTKNDPATDNFAGTDPADVNWYGEYRTDDRTLIITDYDQNPQGDWRFSFMLDCDEEWAEGIAAIKTKDYREAEYEGFTFIFNNNDSIIVGGGTIFDGEYTRYDISAMGDPPIDIDFSDNGEVVIWNGVYAGDGYDGNSYIVEISEEDSERFYFMVKPVTTTALDAVSQNYPVLDDWANFSDDDTKLATGGGVGLYIYPEGENITIDLLTSEGSEWAYLRGSYEKIR